MCGSGRACQDLSTAIRTLKYEHHAIWCYFSRGTEQWILEHRDAAMDDYKRHSILMTNPTYGDIRSAIIRQEQGRIEDSRTILNDVRLRSQNPWLRTIADCISGNLPAQALVDIVDLNNHKRLCEAYYYAGEACRARGDLEQATNWFQLCKDTDVQTDPDSPMDPMSECELAVW
jgi:hypothetical protein